MRYLLLISFDPALLPPVGTPDYLAEWAAYNDCTRALADDGIYESADALQPPELSKCVRVRDGEVLVTDGPFAETKEQIGGFYIVDCESEAEALAAAARIPGARMGVVEVRPILEAGLARDPAFRASLASPVGRPSAAEMRRRADRG